MKGRSKREMGMREGGMKEKQFGLFFLPPIQSFSIRPLLSPPLASVVVCDFRAKESDVTVMELLRRCFFSH